MTPHRNIGFVAAAATLLAAAPLSAIFERWTWLIQATIVVAVVAGSAALSRLARAPLWGQVLAMLAGLTLGLTWIFPSGAELLAFIPTPGTFAHFGELTQTSLEDMRSYGVKVPDVDSLLFLAVLGIGAVAVVVDVLSVGLRRPALAGLPMLAIYSVPVAVYLDSVPATPFVVGAAGYLWLLVTDNVDRVRRFGRRFTGEGRDVDVWEASPLAAAGRRLAVVGVAVAVALPLAVPGMTGGLMNNVGAGPGEGNGRPGQGGSPGRIDLFAALSGQLNQSEETELVKVSTSEPSPFYLRLGVVDDLRPGGFQARVPTGRPVTRGLPDPGERTPRGVERQRYRATVEVSKNLNMPLLPVYADPVKADDLNGNWLYDSSQQIVFSNRENARGKNYSFEYVRSTFSPAALRAAPSLPADSQVMRQQTDRPSVPEVEELVDELVEGQVERLRQGPRDLRVLLRGERLHLLAVHPRRQQRAGHHRLPRHQGRLLPAVRGGDGLAGPGRRYSGPGRRRLHQRQQVRRRHVRADQPQPARVDRGQLRQRDRLGAVRRHPGGERAGLGPLRLGAGHRRPRGGRPVARQHRRSRRGRPVGRPERGGPARQGHRPGSDPGWE